MKMSAPAMHITFQSVRPHFDALARIGYFKIVLKPTTRSMRLIHDAYCSIIWVLILAYNLQHVIRVVQVRHSINEMVDTLFILLTTLNTLGKQAAFNIRSARIDHIIRIIDGPIFAPRNSQHVEIMRKNAVEMSRLLIAVQAAVLFCSCLWAVFPIVNRALGEQVNFTGYIPFDTTPLTAFELTLAYMSIVISIQAYGNATMDCTIVALYCQARIQIQILKYNLERLAEPGESAKIYGKLMNAQENTGYSYKDDGSDKHMLQKRLARCVEHYRVIVWFTKEVESIFGEAMVVQFFVMAWVICMTVYKIVGLNILSAEFVSMAVYLGCMLYQLFIYCYYGTQLQSESEFINQSVYSAQWLQLSPRYRRQLLVLMQYCSSPLALRIASIIPISLDTYISVLRSSYTLFTFLNNN